jgi:hypothetical protein
VRKLRKAELLLGKENSTLKRPLVGRGAERDRLGKLLSPARRRAAVIMLQTRLGLSQRRACRVVGQPRSAQRQPPVCQTAADRTRHARGSAGVRPRARPLGSRPGTGVSGRPGSR